MSEFAGRRVLVVGLGDSGFAAARVLLDLDAIVRVTESETSPVLAERAETLRQAGAEVELGGHDLESLDADIAVLSPGVPPSADICTALRGRGIPVVSEIELAARLAGCEFIAVTGTNGKTTTTSMIGAMLSEAGLPSAVGGNIGNPLIEAVRAMPTGGVIATEVSSFQLATIETFRPAVAVILNIAEDHTDWHGDFASYITAKERIVENQRADDVLVVNHEDPIVMDIAGRARSRVVPFSALGRSLPDGISVHGTTIVWRGEEIMDSSVIPLVGRPGLEDVLAAAAACLEYGVDPEVVARAVKSFRPLPHRMQVVAQSGGITYIDDSKATNPHATLAAVSGLDDVVLIAGGRSKGIDLSPLSATVPPVIAVVAIGESTSEVAAAFEGLVPVERAITMKQAVESAHARAVPGGSVLLAPACASLDMYASYAERGKAFARAVRDLIKHQEPQGALHGDA